MSVRLIAVAWELPLPLAPKMVLVALADNANDEGVCWPVLRTICKKASLCERAVRDCIRMLEEYGCLTVEQRSGRGNVYTVHPERCRLPDPGTRCRSTPAPHAGAPAPHAGVPRHHVPDTPAPDAGVLEPSREPPSEPSHNPRAREAEPEGAEEAEAREGIGRIRADYPEGLYEPTDWIDAERDARWWVGQGFAWAELHAGVQRMAAQHRSKGGDPRYVTSPARFFARITPPRFTGKFPLAPSREQQQRHAREQAEAAELQALMQGRAERGLADFRDPYPHESPAAYGSALRVEENRRRPPDRPLPLVAELVAAKKRRA